MATELLADAHTVGLHRPEEMNKWDELFAQIQSGAYADRPHFIARSARADTESAAPAGAFSWFCPCFR